MENKVLGNKEAEVKFDFEEEIFTGEGDEIVPNCEGGPCNYVYKEKID